jgi:hypothetical protein
MRRLLGLVFGATVATLFSGCETTPLPPGTEQGPHKTIAYRVRIEASEPGARIEVNGEMTANTPMDLKIFGDRDGTFHDFGSYVYVIRALPLTTNQYAQSRVFGTGRGFTHEDKIPDKIYFDMNQPEPAYGPPGGPYPYPYPGYYYPHPYYGPYPYYGPSVRFYYGPYYRHW